MHNAGPYYVFAAGVHTRYDLRVLAEEAVTKKNGCYWYEKDLPINTKIRFSELA